MRNYVFPICTPYTGIVKNAAYHSSHKIRFHCASTAYDGKNLATISKLMEHSDISTTLHYLRNVENEEDRIKAFEHLGLGIQADQALESKDK